MLQFIKNIYAIKKFVGFCEQLLTLLAAGFDLSRSIEIIYADEKNLLFKNKISDLKNKLSLGLSFSSSLTSLLPLKTNLKFEKINIIPDLKLFLSELKSFYQEKINLLNKIGASLIYPLVLLSMTFFLIIIFIFNLLPFYENFFQEFNLKMPFFLILLIFIKNIIINNFLMIIFVLLGLLLVFHKKIEVKINNLIGKILFQENFSDILWLIALLSKSGFDLKTILENISFSNAKLSGNFLKFKLAAEASGSISESFIKTFSLNHYFQERLIICEKSGDFANQLKIIAKELNQIESKKQMIYVKMTQPVLLILLGLMILGLVYLTFLPMINSINNLNY